jgi:adenosylhomocysteine nucleosidase
MHEELELVRAVLDDCRERLLRGTRFLEGNIDGLPVVLLECGIGKVCSTVGAVEMIREYAPPLVINTGVAGAIDPSLRVMDVVVGDEVVYHDVWCGEGNAWGQVQGFPPRFRSDRALHDLALSVLPAVGSVRGGLICSGDRFISGQDELDEIRRHFPAGLAVDMESGSLAQTCHFYGVPFLSYRMISDTPGVEDHERQFRDFWKEVPHRSFEMLRALVRGCREQIINR